MSKTGDIEFTIMAVLERGPITLAELDTHLAWVDDRRWIMVALTHLRRDGRITWTNCDAGHGHDGACVIQAVLP